MTAYDYMILSGGFDPLHSGHIEMIKHAKELSSGGVIVCLNSDAWLTRKKGKPFMTFEERKAVIENIKGVVTVIAMNDDDGTACDGIAQARAMLPRANLAFGNGGDRKHNSTPTKEQEMCKELDIDVAFGIGGFDKKNSSSHILSDWTKETEQRPWGSFTTHEVGDGYKVKTLTIKPTHRLSLQYHNHRSEVWTVLSGCADVELNGEQIRIYTGQTLEIPVGSTHRVGCSGTKACVIMEAQLGDIVSEDDIVRLQDDYARK